MLTKIKNNRIVLVFQLFLTAAVFGLALFSLVKAEDIDCSQLTGDDKDKCEALEEKAQAYRDLINIKNKQANTVQNQLVLLNAEQERNRIQLQQTQAKADDLAQQIDNLNREIEYKENLIKYQQLILTGLIQSYYEYNQEGILKIVLINKDFSEIFNQSDYVEQTSNRVGEVLKAIQDAKAELQREYDDVQQKKIESDQLKKELSDRENDLQASEIQKQALLVKTQGEKEKYQQLLDNIDNEINNLEEQIAGTADYSSLPPDKDGYFTWPVNPHIITQKYGMTSYARSGAYGGKPHNGVDFGIAKGSNVYAVRAGKVVGSGDNGGYAYGKWIAIEHVDINGKKTVTLYGHLNEKKVSKGDKISEGEIIAKSGNTGNSTGPHLHFSVFVSNSFELKESQYVKGLYIPIGASVDPMKYL